eukprot:Tbor_TRINITY_DN3714_c0_g1::TRINITY_DN3714_c0_g1_i1::g.2337::m.2337
MGVAVAKDDGEGYSDNYHRNPSGDGSHITEQVIQVAPPQDDSASDDDCPIGKMSIQKGSDSDVYQFFGDAPPCKYVKKELIGKGAFGEAYMVERQSDKKMFVGKVIDLHAMSQNEKKYAHTEILCLAHSSHFAIIMYVEHMLVDDSTVVIVTEFADSGDFRNNSKCLSLTEEKAGFYFVQLLLALDHIHRRRMIHRDVKSANMFLTSTGLIKLGDFGFSQQYDQTVSSACATTFLGSPYYLAPEMWKGHRYGKKADVWAASIVLFELLTGSRPFNANSMPMLKKSVLEGTFDLPSHISAPMKQFVHKALRKDPTHRPSTQQMLKTPLMQHYIGVLQKHVNDSNNIDSETMKMIERNIKESLDAIKDLPEEEDLGCPAVIIKPGPRHEGVVYKESDSGTWKERYLILEDEFLTLTLKKGGDPSKSKKILTSSILSVAPMTSTSTSSDMFLLAVSTVNSSAIVFGLKTANERDEWLQSMMEVLGMD